MEKAPCPAGKPKSLQIHIKERLEQKTDDRVFSSLLHPTPPLAFRPCNFFLPKIILVLIFHPGYKHSPFLCRGMCLVRRVGEAEDSSGSIYGSANDSLSDLKESPSPQYESNPVHAHKCICHHPECTYPAPALV